MSRTHPVATSARQAIQGVQVGGPGCTSRCAACGRELGPREFVTVYAMRRDGEPEWTVARLYCRGCKDDIHRTPKFAEVLADARLGTVRTPSGGAERLVLCEVQRRETD